MLHRPIARMLARIISIASVDNNCILFMFQSVLCSGHSNVQRPPSMITSFPYAVVGLGWASLLYMQQI